MLEMIHMRSRTVMLETDNPIRSRMVMLEMGSPIRSKMVMLEMGSRIRSRTVTLETDSPIRSRMVTLETDNPIRSRMATPEMGSPIRKEPAMPAIARQPLVQRRATMVLLVRHRIIPPPMGIIVPAIHSRSEPLGLRRHLEMHLRHAMDSVPIRMVQHRRRLLPEIHSTVRRLLVPDGHADADGLCWDGC